MFRRLTFFAERENLKKLKARPTTLTLDISVVAPNSKPKSFTRITFWAYIKLAGHSQDFIQSQASPISKIIIVLHEIYELLFEREYSSTDIGCQKFIRGNGSSKGCPK